MQDQHRWSFRSDISSMLILNGAISANWWGGNVLIIGRVLLGLDPARGGSWTPGEVGEARGGRGRPGEAREGRGRAGEGRGASR